MRTLVIAALAVTLATSAAAGGRPRKVAASPSLQDEVSITFTNVTAGVLDAGDLAYRRTRGAKGRTMTARTFGIRIERKTGDTRGTATLRAYLETYDPRCSIRVDGIELGTAPKVITTQAPLGSVTAHRLEIEVPATAPEGAFAASIGWEVVTN